MGQDIRILKKIKSLIQEDKEDKLQEDHIDSLAELINEYLYTLIRSYLNKNKKTLQENMDLGLRTNIIIEKEMRHYSGKARLYYYMGMYCGIYKSMNNMLKSMEEYKDNYIKLQILYNRDNIKKILLYLYYNPGAQHKVISEQLQFKSNYLSELMHELEDNQCIQRYSESKYSYYELTIDSQNFIKQQLDHLSPGKLYQVKYNYPNIDDSIKLYYNGKDWVEKLNNHSNNIIDFKNKIKLSKQQLMEN